MGDDDLWAWADPTPYVSAEQARASRRRFDALRCEDGERFSEIVRQYRECEY